MLTGRVVDDANILAADDEAKLSAQSEQLEDATGHQLVVVTIRHLGGHPIDEYGTKLGNYWGIGRKNINDGVLVILAPDERKVRISVGKGLETVLTNGEAGAIIQHDMLPAFRENRLPAGIQRGVTSIVRELSPGLEKAA